MKKIILQIIIGAVSLTTFAQKPAFDSEQYQKALWMTTRFYGAQRTGDATNWLLSDYGWTKSDASDDMKQLANLDEFKSGKSFRKDSDGSYSLSGGWLGTSDFMLSGQPFYYSLYMLLLGYSEFTDGYSDLYSDNYAGYNSTGNFTWEGKKGKSNGIPDVLDECYHAADFALKAVRNSSTFYYEKGDYDADQSYWCTSVFQSVLPKSMGGNADGARSFAKAEGNVTSMASLAGASLAAMYRLYKDYDLLFATKCIDKAEIAFDFVTGTPMGNSGSSNSSLYAAKPDYLPDLTILCAELYRASGDEKYLAKCNEFTKQWISNIDNNSSLNVNSTFEIALYAYCAMGEGNTYYKECKDALKKIVSGYQSEENILKYADGADGKLGYVANEAFALSLYSKLDGEAAVNEKVLRTVEYIMGGNSEKYSYIVGFNANGTTDFPLYPNHKNFYRSDCGSKLDVSMTPDNKFAQLGMLVGGYQISGKSDSPDSKIVDITCDGGIEHNCGLVGALAYICEKITRPINPQGNKSVNSVTILYQPLKTEYGVGESLNVTGGVITVKYSDGSSDNLNITTSMISGFSSTKGGQKILTVSYGGKSATFSINVVKQPKGIAVQKAPKTEYLVGELLDVTDATIKYIYDDQTFDLVNLTPDMVSGFQSDEVGESSATISYKDFDAELTITILASKITYVELYKTPRKTVYTEGEELDIDGGKLYVQYEDGSENVLEVTKQMITNFESSALGTYSLEIRYGDFSLNYDITINAVSTAVGEIQNLASEKIYSYGQAIYLDGVEGRVEVYNLMGRRVFSGSGISEIHISEPGIYIVRTLRSTKKVAVVR